MNASSEDRVDSIYREAKGQPPTPWIVLVLTVTGFVLVDKDISCEHDLHGSNFRSIRS